MKHSDNKQTGVFSFSYIDIFFLLLAGLILSVGIGFLAEAHRSNQSESYQVYLTSPVESALKHAIPMAGDVVYGEDGEPYGRVLTVSTEDVGNKQILRIKCRLDGERPLVGEELIVETPNCVRKMQVYSVESADL